MKNDTICVNLCMENGQINHWLSMLYSVEKHGFTNDQLVSMIKSECTFWSLNYTDIVDVHKIQMDALPVVVVDNLLEKKIKHQRKIIFDLGKTLYYPHNNSNLRRNQILIDIRQRCDAYGFDENDFNFGTLPEIKEFVPKPFIRSQSPVVITNSKFLPVPVKIAKAVIVPEIEVLMSEIKESPFFPEGSEIPHCPDCHKPVDGSNNNRFKMSSVVGYKVCSKCYQSHYQLNKQRQYDAVFQ